MRARAGKATRRTTLPSVACLWTDTAHDAQGPANRSVYMVLAELLQATRRSFLDDGAESWNSPEINMVPSINRRGQWADATLNLSFQMLWTLELGPVPGSGRP